MNPSRSRPESRLDRLTRRWWFYLIIVFITFLPLYSQKPYDPRQTSQVINEVLMRPLIYSAPGIFPLFKIIPIILIAWLFVQPRKAYRYQPDRNCSFTEHGFHPSVWIGNHHWKCGPVWCDWVRVVIRSLASHCRLFSPSLAGARFSSPSLDAGDFLDASSK